MEDAVGGIINGTSIPCPLVAQQYNRDWPSLPDLDGKDAVVRSMEAVEQSNTLLSVLEDGRKRALKNVRDAFSSLERVKRYQTLLSELVSCDLYEQDDGQVRKALNNAERIEMKDKLLNAGHEIGYAQTALQVLQNDPLYRTEC
jgi:hypothetical protein